MKNINRTETKTFDVIVVGAGHAGSEAALAAARMGLNTALFTMSINTIAKMPCNPAIGGVAKGHLVREIDALGGEMAKNIDKTSIQFRMLNRSKGPAVWAPRAQADKKKYSDEMRQTIQNEMNLKLFEATIERLIVEDGIACGIEIQSGEQYSAKAIIITTGTFMHGLCHVGDTSFKGGRRDEKPSYGISDSLRELGFSTIRLKTGTPPRLHSKSINYDVMDIQYGENEPYFFSFSKGTNHLPQVPCYITHTTQKTRQIIKNNIHRSPLYSGKIVGIGPRYCPSIEDKIMRFQDKLTHHIFLEPEGLDTHEIYVNGASTSFPKDVQDEIIHSITGLENAEIIHYGYAVEYDFLPPTQIFHTLETKSVKGLYFAGQINGTSGYEEAAAQGLISGINASLKILGKAPFILKRSEAYIGVLIDDLVTKGTKEPYRMFTSRAEHRLILRQDNADIRLMDYGYQLGLIGVDQYNKLCDKRNNIQLEIGRIQSIRINQQSLYQYLKRPGSCYKEIINLSTQVGPELSADEINQIEIHAKYEGYINRELSIIERKTRWEDKDIPSNFDYTSVIGLRNEAKEKLTEIMPISLGQASRISGVSPADISVLMMSIFRQ